MKKVSFEDFMKKYNLKNFSMNESEIQSFHKIYPRDSWMTINKKFVKIEDGSQGGIHWTCFIVKDNKSFYYDSFGGQAGEILLNQLPEPILSHNYKIQDINSNICASCCLYFFYSIERIISYDTIFKMCFDKVLQTNDFNNIFFTTKTLLKVMFSWLLIYINFTNLNTDKSVW